MVSWLTERRARHNGGDSCYNDVIMPPTIDPATDPNAPDIASAAYRSTTDGALPTARPWQTDLYARLSRPDGDLGGLLLAPTGAGKTEAVVIPALGLRRGGAPRRLFLIGPDGSPLDDALYRLVPYLRSSVLADETARTLCLDATGADEGEGGDGNGESGATTNVCRRFFPNGSEDPHVVTNPLEADVDLILTTLGRFGELFFGSGGVHALPAALADTDSDVPRRDLFFFDEAHGYGPEAFARFHRLVEFLFAEDLDVLVGSCTLPPAFAEELGFLDTLPAPVGVLGTPPTLAYKPSPDPLALIESEVRRAYFQNSRVFAVTETIADALALHARLAPSYPHSVYLYHPALPAQARRLVYAQLRELEKEGEGYLLLTTGDALESSDLDATVLLSTLCPPENLIRRAGRCNRRGDLPSARVVLFAPAQAADYLAALRAQTDLPFDPALWKAFI